MGFVVWLIVLLIVAVFAGLYTLAVTEDRPPPGLEYSWLTDEHQIAETTPQSWSDSLANGLALTAIAVVMGCYSVYWCGRKLAGMMFWRA